MTRLVVSDMCWNSAPLHPSVSSGCFRVDRPVAGLVLRYADVTAKSWSHRCSISSLP